MKTVKPDKKKRVYFEQVKAQHTTHWDLDYLSQAELEALYTKNRRRRGYGRRQPNRGRSGKLPAAAVAGAAAVLLALILLLAFRCGLQ
ncbi:MAG: hypothetical protein AMJ54_12630 [Deltaproteobacteria bacterium SG8_13]|nr:MAG: hypothetical protein AMJ54_12630 [Deltaproteobacteria bacterium SG8_13]